MLASEVGAEFGTDAQTSAYSWTKEGQCGGTLAAGCASEGREGINR